MPEITYVNRFDKEITADLDIGTNLMRGALDNDVPGISGDCGGCCACGTCHIVLDERWMAQVPERSDMEEAMLEIVQGASAGSRLACQIEVTEDLDGMTVLVPDALDE